MAVRLNLATLAEIFIIIIQVMTMIHRQTHNQECYLSIQYVYNFIINIIIICKYILYVCTAHNSTPEATITFILPRYNRLVLQFEFIWFAISGPDISCLFFSSLYLTDMNIMPVLQFAISDRDECQACSSVRYIYRDEYHACSLDRYI